MQKDHRRITVTPLGYLALAEYELEQTKHFAINPIVRKGINESMKYIRLSMNMLSKASDQKRCDK